jgi:hypothetical protein
MPKASTLAVVFCVLTFNVRQANGQEQAGRAYASGSMSLMWQADAARIAATPGGGGVGVFVPGGTTVGWSATLGGMLTPLISTELEIASTGRMSLPLLAGTAGNRPGERIRQDLFIGGHVRWHVLGSSARHVEPVVGIVAVERRAWIRITAPSTQPGVLPRTDIPTPSAFGVSVGVDGRFGNRRMAFVPTFRLRFSGNGVAGDEFKAFYPGGGLPRVTVSYGGGVRYDF